MHILFIQRNRLVFPQNFAHGTVGFENDFQRAIVIYLRWIGLIKIQIHTSVGGVCIRDTNENRIECPNFDYCEINSL